VVRGVKEVARENGVIILKNASCCGTSVNFVVIKTTDRGLLPDPRQISVISQFPVPADVAPPFSG
jgi:hypothetical protein